MGKRFSLWNRSTVARELDDEMQFHLDELIAENIAAGMTHAEARRRAYVVLGNPQRLQEECRQMYFLTATEDFLRDLMFALRTLIKARRLTVMAALSLALGIGCSTIVFSIVYNGMLHPFPYRDADRLATVRLDATQNSGRGGRSEFSLDEVNAFRTQAHTLEDVVGTANWYVTYTHDRTAEVVHGVAITPNAMPFFGVQPLAGRGATEQDSAVNAAPVALLNYRFWKKQFHEDKSIIGTSIMLDDRAHTIIGVMPPRFQLTGADLWIPVAWSANRPFASNEPHFFWADAIVKRGISLSVAARDLETVTRHLASVSPEQYPPQFVFVLRTLSDTVVADFKRMLLLLTAAVGLLLLISCSNAAGLLLAHATTRTREIAVRSALGASRGRLIRQFFVESLVLAFIACAAGSILAVIGLREVVAHVPLTQIPWEAKISINWPTLIFALTAAFIVTTIAGIAPALLVLRGNLRQQLAGTSTAAGAGSYGSRFRSALVVCQIALCVILLTTAELTLRSYIALSHVDPGIRETNMLEGWVHFPRGSYQTSELKRDFINELLSRLQALPGVIDAAEAIGRPLSLDQWPSSDVTIPGKPHKEEWRTSFEVCSDSYFKTLGLRLLRGRLLTPEDIADGRKVAVVNRTLVQHYFGKQDPIGQRIRFNQMDKMEGLPHGAYFEIVGVVSDFRNQGIAMPTLPQAFLPHSFSGFGDRGILLHTAVKPTSLLNSVRQTLWQMDPGVVLADPSSIEDDLTLNFYAKPKFNLISLGACAIVGLLLSLLGISSVMAYMVSALTHEIGVRIALGAKRSVIFSMVLRKGLLLVTAGLGLGLVASLLLLPVLRSQVWGVSTFDAPTFLLVGGALLAAGLVACCLPALRATRIDPLTALRYE